jgi:cytochrome b subunit of formate dehydrogenase
MKQPEPDRRADGETTGSGTSQPHSPALDAAQRGHGPFVWRFNLLQRWLHGLLMVSFFMLVLTGIPLRFSCAPFSPALMSLWGGVANAGLIHRIAAVVMVGAFLTHVGAAALALYRNPDRRRLLWGPDSIVPQPHDVRDFVQQFRWFFGLGPQPRFGRFSYMEKFDYMAVFWGVFIIGGSGLLLWFPEFFARWLPGWVFNVATIVHGEEALLATTFIFTIHFFNVHLRPDKFPLDAVMFTGRATLEYMREEHPVLADGLPDVERQPVSARAVHDLPAPSPSRRSTLFATIFGFAAWGVGLATIGMMLWAVLC